MAQQQFDGKAVVEQLIASAPVVLISKSYCPHCKKANGILGQHTNNIVKKEIDQDYSNAQQASIQAYCKELTGASSVPRVFIGGKCIGGCDDTDGLNKQNKLKPLIDAAVKQ